VGSSLTKNQKRRKKMVVEKVYVGYKCRNCGAEFKIIYVRFDDESRTKAEDHLHSPFLGFDELRQHDCAGKLPKVFGPDPPYYPTAKHEHPKRILSWNDDFQRNCEVGQRMGVAEVVWFEIY